MFDRTTADRKVMQEAFAKAVTAEADVYVIDENNRAYAYADVLTLDKEAHSDYAAAVGSASRSEGHARYWLEALNVVYPDGTSERIGWERCPFDEDGRRIGCEW